MNGKTKQLAVGAQVAAMYVAICYLQNVLLPGSNSGAVQLRVAESLCVLAFFTPAAIPGLALGCLLFNVSTVGVLPLDFLAGTAATALAAGGMWCSRKVTVKGYPLPGMLLPAVCNGLLVGWELAVQIGGGFWLNCLYVALGELLVLLSLGSALFYGLKAHKNRLFPE